MKPFTLAILALGGAAGTYFYMKKKKPGLQGLGKPVENTSSAFTVSAGGKYVAQLTTKPAMPVEMVGNGLSALGLNVSAISATATASDGSFSRYLASFTASSTQTLPTNPGMIWDSVTAVPATSLPVAAANIPQGAKTSGVFPKAAGNVRINGGMPNGSRNLR